MSTESDEKPRLTLSDGREAASRSAGGVGARLRAAREGRQATLREIAATTKISVSALEALEQTDVSSLPGGIFTRAFVRSYATEVGLDPEETMREFMVEVDEALAAESAPADAHSREHDPFQSQQRMAGTVLKLILVGLPVALLLFFVTRDVGVPEDAAEPPAGVVDTSAPPPRAAPPIRPSPAPPALATGAPLALVLSPRDECWVSLTIDGDVVFSRVMRAGESVSYQAEEEIILNIGDAGAFGFALNDRDGRSLGDLGEVVTATITPQNYRSFITP